MQLHELIKTLRTSRGRKTNELADSIGTHYNTLYRFFNGEKTISSEILEKVLLELGIDLNEVILEHISKEKIKNNEKSRMGNNILYLLDKGLNKLEKRTLLNTIVRKAKQRLTNTRDPQVHRILKEVASETSS